jgi:hypothetical protein
VSNAVLDKPTGWGFFSGDDDDAICSNHQPSKIASILTKVRGNEELQPASQLLIFFLLSPITG